MKSPQQKNNFLSFQQVVDFYRTKYNHEQRHISPDVITKYSKRKHQRQIPFVMLRAHQKYAIRTVRLRYKNKLSSTPNNQIIYQTKSFHSKSYYDQISQVVSQDELLYNLKHQLLPLVKPDYQIYRRQKQKLPPESTPKSIKIQGCKLKQINQKPDFRAKQIEYIKMKYIKDLTSNKSLSNNKEKQKNIKSFDQQSGPISGWN